MVITLEPELEAALREKARRGGIGVEILVLDTLRQRFLPPIQPRDEWERQLLAAATPCGVSVSDEALSREAMYE